MNNEETILDPQYGKGADVNDSATATQLQAESKKTNWAEKAAYAAGGAVVGAGATIAGQAMAANIPTEEPETDGAAEAIANEAAAEAPKPENSPAPEDSIIATATGVRVAQVDDDASFAQAFADARAQVGPGGVFEWHGRVYGTYYKDEWEAMTPQERHDYQASIEYGDVLSSESQAAHHNEMAHHAVHHHSEPTHHSEAPEQPQDLLATSVEDDGEVHVLSVGQTDLNGDGVPEDAAVLEINGHQILLVDIDQDGTADAVIADVDGNGEISSDEIFDVRDEQIEMPGIDPGQDYLAQASNEPDYMNDADVGMYDA